MLQKRWIHLSCSILQKASDITWALNVCMHEIACLCISSCMCICALLLFLLLFRLRVFFFSPKLFSGNGTIPWQTYTQQQQQCETRLKMKERKRIRYKYTTYLPHAASSVYRFIYILSFYSILFLHFTLLLLLLFCVIFFLSATKIRQSK